MRYAFIAAHAEEYAVTVLCQAMEVSVSGYYAWRTRGVSRREQDDAALSTHIQRVFAAGRQVYGSPRVHATLHAEGIAGSRKRVARLMRTQHLAAQGRRPRKPRTTDSGHTQPVAPNRLARDFTAAATDEKWVADITAIATQAGWLYLAAILDVYSRRVIGWAMDAHRDEQLVVAALRMALAHRRPHAPLLHHSDRGSQYTSAAYQAELAHAGITVSMSRKGDCYDNALMESFFATLKAECADRAHFQTQAEAQTCLFDYLEVFYNRQRLHSALGYRAPITFEQPHDS